MPSDELIFTPLMGHIGRTLLLPRPTISDRHKPLLAIAEAIISALKGSDLSEIDSNDVTVLNEEMIELLK